MKCPKCGSEIKQHKIGKNPSGSQRHRCYLCGYKYTPDRSAYAYDKPFRQKAIQMYLAGVTLRQIGRILGVHHQSVANWLRAYAEHTELDAVLTFIGDKKTEST